MANDPIDFMVLPDDPPQEIDFMGPTPDESGLTGKEARFVEEYLVDLNATQAAIRAGYSERSAGQIGFDVLRKPHVRDAVQAAQKERSARTGITADRVIQELAKVAFANKRELMDWGPGGVTLKSSESLTEDQAAAVSEVSETVNLHGGSIKLKTHDKVKALDLLGKHLGIYDEKGPSDDGQKVVFYLPDNGR